jgi:hypothetical protein
MGVIFSNSPLELQLFYLTMLFECKLERGEVVELAMECVGEDIPGRLSLEYALCIQTQGNQCGWSR